MSIFVNKTVNTGSPFKICSRRLWCIFIIFLHFAGLFTIDAIRD